MRVGSAIKFISVGAILGALGLAFIGFVFAGWVTNTTLTETSRKQAATAVVSALAPICADRFRRDSAVIANLSELNKQSGLSMKGNFIEHGGWATMPGGEGPNWAVARACAEILSATEGASFLKRPAKEGTF